MSEDPPKAPNQAKSYQAGIDVYLKNLPQLLAAEAAARGQYDPERIAQQQALQGQFGPTQYQQQLDALHQLDPTGSNVREGLGQNVFYDLFNPPQQGLYDRLSGIINNELTNQPGEKVYNKLQSDVMGQLWRPEGQDVYNTLHKRVLSDLKSGYKLPEGLANELEQSIRGAQSARGNVLGGGPASAESVYKGQNAINLYQQHLQNAEDFNAATSPGARSRAEAASFYGLATPGQRAQQDASGFYNLNTPQQKTYDNAGQFLGLPTPEQQIALIQPVSPDRSAAYTNPNAGYQGQQFALNNYQNMLAQQQLAGGGNSWTRALVGAGVGAAQGYASTGSYWGALAGGAAGGYGGYTGGG